MSEKLSEAVVDFANALEAACVQLKRYIAEQHGVGVKEETFTSLLGWTPSKGERLGNFEWCGREANNNSAAFNRAMAILKTSSATIKNQFGEENWKHKYWYYEDRIFRRAKKGKQEPPKQEGQEPRMEATKRLFPKALEEMLTFEVQGNYTIIKPRQYLGSENFSKIAAIVREAGGEYISAGKQSHFRVPLER